MRFISVAALAVLLAACNSNSEDPASENAAVVAPPANSLLQLSQFNSLAMADAAQFVSCTLENGSQSTCAQLTVKYKPDDLPIGPFCPATLDSSGGIWDWDGQNAGLYRIDRTFLEMLNAIGFTFYEPDGTVHTVDNATTPPTVDHACINVTPDTKVTMTTLIPATPVMSGTTQRLGTVGKVGMALNGTPVFSDAPSVLRTGHMPALDTCGGHVDPGGWFHWHAAATDIETVYETEGVNADCALAQNPAGLFAYAFDGFPIYGSREPNGALPTGLDACNGHIGAIPGVAGNHYHYHASEDFPNLPPCLSGVVAQNNFKTTAQAGIGSQNASGRRGPPPGSGRAGPGRRGPDFAAAAAQLGLPEDTLRDAMDRAGGPQADLALVAAELGVSESALRAALPPPPQGRGPRPQ